MVKSPTINSFYNRIYLENSEVNNQVSQVSKTHIDPNIVTTESQSRKFSRIERNINCDVDSLKRDHELGSLIWDYHVDKHDEIRRACVKTNSYQIILSKYTKSNKSVLEVFNYHDKSYFYSG